MTVAGVGRLAELKRGARVGVHADCLDRLSQCCRILCDPAVRAKVCFQFIFFRRATLLPLCIAPTLFSLSVCCCLTYLLPTLSDGVRPHSWLTRF